MTKAVHRHPAGTKAARQIMSATSMNRDTSDRLHTSADYERDQWNKLVSAKRKIKPKESSNGTE